MADSTLGSYVQPTYTNPPAEAQPIAQTGTWNIAGINLPDFQLTENFASPGNKTFFNPVYASDSTMAPAATNTVSPMGNIQAQSSSNPPPSSGNPAPSPAPSGGTPQKGPPNTKVPGGYYNGNGDFVSVGGGPSQIDIDNAYGEANSFYDQMLNQANSGKQDFLNAYTQPYDALKPGYEQALTTGTNLLGQQRSDVGMQTQNALAAARKLYNDLTQGIRQRFGGSSSAGEFANEFQGRELQNQMGNVRNTEGQNMQQINMKQTELQNQYQANLKELELQKAAALSKATDAFNQRIQAITEAKGQLAQQKAAAKINELQNYRALASSIQSQAQQAAQQLQLQLLSGQQALAQTVAGAQSYAGQPVNLSAVPTQYAQMLGGQSYNPSAFATSITGNIGGTRRDQYGIPQ